MTFATEEAGQILSQDARGRVLVSRERRESWLEEYDRSGMSAVKFAQYVGNKYSTLAYWLQSRRRHRQREKLLVKAGADTEPGKSNGGWIEAVVENASGPRVPAGAYEYGAIKALYEQRPGWGVALKHAVGRSDQRSGSL